MKIIILYVYYDIMLSVIKMKYIFFDIDGTLVATKDQVHYIPESTKQTIRRLKENGHVVGVASGRSMAQLRDVVEELELDYVVSDGGNGVMYKGEILHISPLDKDITLRFAAELLEKKIPFAFMITPHINEVNASSVMLNHKKIFRCEDIGIVIDDDFDYKKHDAYKIFFSIRQGEEDLVNTIDARKIVRYFDEWLAYECDDKYKGVKEIVELDNGNVDDIIFFGDGLNDIPMFEKVKTSIAMGNAVQDLKEIATFVTKRCDEDGILYACEYLGLI